MKFLFQLIVIVCIIVPPLAIAGAADSMDNLRIGSGSEKGLYYPFAVSIAKLIGQSLNVQSAKGLSTAGSAYNVEGLFKKDLEFSMVQNDVAFYSFENLENIFYNNNLRAIGSFYSEEIHIVVRKASGIKTLADMVGKKINIGGTKSGPYRNAKQILGEAGLFNKIRKEYLTTSEAVAALKKGEIDGMFYTVGWPAPAITEIANGLDCRFISLDDELIKQMVADYPFYVKSFIPASVYKGLDENINTIAIRSTLCVRSDIPESLVYAISKLIFENTDTLATSHPKWDNADLMYSRLGVGIPFHPGAARYFEENTVVVKKRPYDGAPMIGYVRQGTKLSIIKEKWNRYQVSTPNHQVGWIEKKFVGDVSKAGLNGYVVKASSLNFRNQPSLNALSIGLLRGGEKVEKVDEKFNKEDHVNWIRVRRENGGVGWASSKYLKKSKYDGHTGVINTTPERSLLLTKAQDKWLKGESWVVEEEVIQEKVEEVVNILTPVDITVLNEKLDLFELRNGLPSTSSKPYEERIKLMDNKLDSKTKDSIMLYLTEVKKRI